MKKLFILILVFLFITPSASALEFERYIEDAFKCGIITGDENGEFHKDKIATRAEFATIAVRFLGLSGGVNIFSDVSDTDWFCSAISAASLHGMLAGYEDGHARPYEPISCEDAVSMLGRYYDAKADAGLSLENVSDYAIPYFRYAIENELFQHPEYAEPKHYVTKGEILALMYEYSRSSNETIHFTSGYPKISEKGVFNNISVTVKTNAPCSIYYGISDTEIPFPHADAYLCEITKAGAEGNIHIPVALGKTYSLYLRPVDADGISGKITVINNLQALPYSTGNGTAADPYAIYSGEQLAAISQYPDKAYRLESDITLDGEWMPITDFSGSLNGNGYRIKGLKISESLTDAGLFAVINGGTVKNLSVDADIIAKANAGAIAGRNLSGTITGCTVTGKIMAKTNNAGGICGTNSGTISGCLSACYSVSADSFAGGICAQNYNLVEKCLSATEAVVSQMCAGGVSGTNSGGKISLSVAANMTVYNSMTYNSGKISTNKQGGVVKDCYSYDALISNASYETPGKYSQSGIPVSWETLISPEFYATLGWENWQSAENGYRLIYPAGATAPSLEKGLTAYMPMPVSTPQELYALGKNEAGHYILTRDITLKTPWKTIFAQNGFSGSLDGNGHTIYNLKLLSEKGMFSNITGGTVKNLKLANVSAAPSSSGGLLTTCNYGYIINCTVTGTIQTSRAGTIGGIAAENYGEISGCTVRVDIKNNNDNSTTGGICGENNGVIANSYYTGKMSSTGKNVVFGGIAGYCTAGYISDSFAELNISLDSTSAYMGGICGVASSAQLYKCASSGFVNISGRTVYSGGIAGAAEQSTIYNCLSAAEIHSSSRTAYVGGICGFNSASNIQNTYASGSIVSVGENDIFTGGICGYAEDGFVMQNVSLNPSLNSSGQTGAIIGGFKMCEVSDNYSCQRMLINSKRISVNTKNGIIKPLGTLKATDFYFRPISGGGLLGWDNSNGIWTSPEKNSQYQYPVLSGMEWCRGLKMPTYK